MGKNRARAAKLNPRLEVLDVAEPASMLLIF